MTKKNINQDWRTDFNWMDPEDVQLDVIRKNTEVEEGELGPDNKEARTLMFAMVQGIELKKERNFAELDVAQGGNKASKFRILTPQTIDAAQENTR